MFPDVLAREPAPSQKRLCHERPGINQIARVHQHVAEIILSPESFGMFSASDATLRSSVFRSSDSASAAWPRSLIVIAKFC